ncbi:MAG: glycosyltransferase [Bacteroidia bacterium]
MGKTYHICHLSLLNPAIHSRIFFKMARSQVAAGYRVSIIAQDPAPAPYERDGVRIVPLPVFGRLSWRRRWAVGRIRRLAVQECADAYQVHTVELLGQAARLRGLLPDSKWVYDMHEDYAGNILHADYYPDLLRPWLARKVRAAETDFAKWGHGLILAEACFQGLMDFAAERTALVQNKFQMPPSVEAPSLSLEQPDLPMLLHTGTIARKLGRNLERWNPGGRSTRRDLRNLVIAGHSHDHELLRCAPRRMRQACRGGLHWWGERITCLMSRLWH